MRPGILLDRDGTIIHDYHYVGHVERVELIPGAADAIARFNKAGIPVAIVTNQSGVARGFYPERNVHVVHAYIERELALHDAHIDLFLYSPHHPDGTVKDYIFDSYYHKPSPGMAIQAKHALDLDLSQSVVVGDRPEDVRLAHSVCAHAVYLGTDTTGIPAWIHPAEISRFNSLADAAGFIIERITGVAQSEFPTMNYTGMIGYFNHYVDEIRSILGEVQAADISRAAEVLTTAYNNGGNVFVAGNGGAAAIADHFVADHIKHMGSDPTWFTRVTSLSSNTPLITMAANDIGYDAVFSYQLARLAVQQDVLVVFSVSGDSANIIRALQIAREIRVTSIAVVARSGGKAAGMADVTIHIPTSNYGIAEDVMSVIQHSIAQFIRQSRMSDEAVRSARF
jgi:D,D-heptose 1,7-bisphosphate phosphatase